jgi:putative copper resistance protein D
MLLQVVTLTALGKVWCLRVVIAIVTVLTVHSSSVSRSTRAIRRVAIVTGLALAGFSLSGHAAANEGWLGALHEAVDAVHILAAGAWLGSLIPFFYWLDALRNLDHRRDATAALITFSNLGHAAVAITLLSGVANTWLILRDWPIHWHTPYQVLLCLKIACTIAMVWVAIVNRYVWVPRLKAQPVRAIETIRQRTVLGVVLGLTVVCLVSVFGMLSPQ